MSDKLPQNLEFDIALLGVVVDHKPKSGRLPQPVVWVPKFKGEEPPF